MNFRKQRPVAGDDVDPTPKGARPCGSEPADACSPYALRALLSGLAMSAAIAVGSLCAVAWTVSGFDPLVVAGAFGGVTVAAIAIADLVVLRRRTRERANARASIR